MKANKVVAINARAIVPSTTQPRYNQRAQFAPRSMKIAQTPATAIPISASMADTGFLKTLPEASCQKPFAMLMRLIAQSARRIQQMTVTEVGRDIVFALPNAVLTGAGHATSGNGAPYHRVRLKTQLDAGETSLSLYASRHSINTLPVVWITGSFRRLIICDENKK